MQIVVSFRHANPLFKIHSPLPYWTCFGFTQAANWPTWFRNRKYQNAITMKVTSLFWQYWKSPPPLILRKNLSFYIAIKMITRTTSEAIILFPVFQNKILTYRRIGLFVCLSSSSSAAAARHHHYHDHHHRMPSSTGMGGSLVPARGPALLYNRQVSENILKYWYIWYLKYSKNIRKLL